MRARSREVNIFNMSLLDILTGMLGAFLFLMLGLVPYYTKAQKSGNGNADQQPAVDTMFNIITRWDSDAKVDLFLHTDGGWFGPNEKSRPLSGRAKISAAACPSGDGWAMVSVYAAVGDRYLFAVSPQGAFNPEDLRHMRFSMELIEAQIKTDGSGFKSFYPNAWLSTFDASGTRPNTLYGLGWVKITKDESKGTADDFNLQYNYTYDPVKDGESLPDGAIPLPAGAPISVTPVSSGSSAPATTTTVVTNYVTVPIAPSAGPGADSGKPSMWNPLNWFRSAPPAPK